MMKTDDFYRQIVQNAPFGYAYHQIILDDSGDPYDCRFIEVNETFMKLTSLKKQNLIGKTAREALPGIENSEFNWIAFYGKIALAGGEETFTQFSEPLGKWYKVTVYSAEKMFFTTVFNDVTDQKQKEEALLESEEKFRAMFNQSTEGIYLHDLQGRVLDVNEMACEQSGYTREEWLKLNVLDLLPDESARNLTKEEVLRLWTEWRPGQKYTLEAEHQRKDGLVYPVEISTGVIRYQDENVIMANVRDITDRKKTENSLRESEEFNQKLLATIPDLVVRTDIEGNIIFVNEPDIFNVRFLPKEDLLGKNMLSFIHDKDLERAKENTRMMFDKPLGIKEYTLVANDGGYIVCEVNGDVVRDIENNPLGMVYVIRDVTERIEAEDALRESESRLKKIFEILPVGLWFADKDGTLIGGNPAGIKIWGAEPKVPITEYGVFKAWRLPSGKEIQPQDWALAKTIKEGVTIKDELLEIEAFDGSRKIILNYTAPVNDENGEMLGAIVVNLDVTKRIEAEEALRESEKKFRAMFNQSTEGIYLHDLQGRILDVNEMACEQSGYSRNEWLSRTIFDGLPDENTSNLPKEAILKLWTEWKPGQKHTVQAEHRHKDGTVYPVEISTGIIRYKDENVIMALVRDITERKKSEMELKERMDELERFQKITVGREHKMLDLKKEVNELLEKLGENKKYHIVS